MRLFVAIELAPWLQKKIISSTYKIRSVAIGKWVEQNNLHLTLAFLGEIKDSAVPAIIKAITQAVKGIPPMNLVIGDLTGIPAKYPRLLALNIKASDNYWRLQNSIMRNLNKLGLKALSRQPHLTLVRLKKPLSRLPAARPLALKFQVSQISLIQSILTPKGPIYKRLKALNLTSEGLRPRLRPNIAICVFNPKNEVLLIRNSQHHKRDWQFPQGGIESTESSDYAAKRELKEEVGLENIKIIKLLEKIYHYHWPKNLIKRNLGHSKEGFIGQEQSLAIASINEERPKLITNPREASFYKWVNYKNLLKAVSPVRRDLARIAMVELNKIITNVK